MLEQYALQKKIVFPISSEKFETFEFDFDYYIHEKDFFESIYQLDIENINIQTLLNLLVVVGLIPVTGVTLPFLSYGGSSLLVSMTMIGIILNISKNKDS